MKIKQVLIVLTILIFCSVVSYRLGVLAQITGSLKSVVEPGSMVTEDSYVIFTDGTTVYARNGLTGEIVESSNSASEVIQYAIDSLTNGGKIFIKNGIYNIDSSLYLSDYITLEGEGINTTLNLISNSDVIRNKNYGGQNPNIYMKIANIKIDGNRNAGRTSGVGVHWKYVRKSEVENVLIVYMPNECVYIEGQNPGYTDESSVENQFVDLRLYYCGESGINITGAYDNTFIRTYAQENLKYGFELRSGSNQYYHPHAFNNKYGYYIISRNNYFNRLEADTNKEVGVYLYSSYASRNVFDSPFVYNSGQTISSSGIVLNGSSYNIFHDVIAVDSQTTHTQKYGIEEYGTADYNQFVSGIVSGNIKSPQIFKTGSNTITRDVIGYDII